MSADQSLATGRIEPRIEPSLSGDVHDLPLLDGDDVLRASIEARNEAAMAIDLHEKDIAARLTEHLDPAGREAVGEDATLVLMRLAATQRDLTTLSTLYEDMRRQYSDIAMSYKDLSDKYDDLAARHVTFGEKLLALRSSVAGYFERAARGSIHGVQSTLARFSGAVQGAADSLAQRARHSFQKAKQVIGDSKNALVDRIDRGLVAAENALKDRIVEPVLRALKQTSDTARAAVDRVAQGVDAARGHAVAMKDAAQAGARPIAQMARNAGASMSQWAAGMRTAYSESLEQRALDRELSAHSEDMLAMNAAHFDPAAQPDEMSQDDSDAQAVQAVSRPRMRG